MKSFTYGLQIHYKFLFSYRGSNAVYNIYLFCLEARSFFEHRGSKLFVFVSVFGIAATVSAGILDYSSIEYTRSTWFVLIVSLMLRTYFKTVLVPIFYPVRFSSNPLESGRWQIKHFHSSRSLYMPLGGAGKEFVKSIGKFALAYPKTTFFFGSVGFSVPMSQYIINKQTAFDLSHKSAQAVHQTSTLSTYGKLIESSCAPGTIFNKDVCQGYTEVFNLSLEAMKKTF